jgi:tetratricopeptide (TPR) repeat protein
MLRAAKRDIRGYLKHVSELDEARATFERAVSFLRGGHAAMTEQIVRAALRDYPGEVNFLTLLGASLMRQGRLADAEFCLRQVVDGNPEHGKSHEQLAEVLLLLGRPGEAVELFRRAVELDPALDAALLKLGQTLLSLGREDEAQAAMESFVSQTPHRRKLKEAAELHRSGNHKEAEKIYRSILAEDPDNVSAIRMLALLAMKLEHYRDATVLLKQVVKLAPDFRVALLDLGHAQTELHELDEAVVTIKRAISLEPTNYGGYIALANALARSSRTAEAVAAYRKAAELRPELPGTYLGLGNVLKTLGDQHEAIEAYRKGISIQPGFAELYWSLSNLKTFRFAMSEIEAMKAQLAKPDLSDDATIHFCFALGKSSEDSGDYAEAFGYYERGNRLRRAKENYDAVHTEDIGERIREVFSKDFLARNEGKGYRGVRPIFIVGLPRSGSTLIEQILASHPEVEATHELPEGGRLIRFIDRNAVGRKQYPDAVRHFSADEFAALGGRYDHETRRYRSGASCFIDKMPNNFANLGLLSLILPDALFINAMRDPMDTCLSCYKQLFARGQSFTYDLEDLGYYYLEYRRMMDHWHFVMPGRIIDVQYEDVVKDLSGEVARLLDYCGIPWDDACLDFHNTKRAVRTASSEQVRQPIYTDAIGYWRKFGNKLSLLEEILEPVRDNRQ